MRTLYKVSTISDEILRFNTKISDLNEKIQKFQQEIKDLRFQYPHELNEQRERELNQMSDMIIQMYHIRITNTVNDMLTYLRTNVLTSEAPYYSPDGELSEQ